MHGHLRVPFLLSVFYLQAASKSFEQSEARHVAPPWRQPGNFLGCHGRWWLKCMLRLWRRSGSHLIVETYARSTSEEPMLCAAQVPATGRGSDTVQEVCSLFCLHVG